MKKGYTILEILVASSIFALAMVIASGAIGSASSFQGKLREYNKIAASSRKLADQLTRDVREAREPFYIVTDAAGTKAYFKDGIAMVKCQSTCATTEKLLNAASNLGDNLSGNDPDVHVLITKSEKEKIKIWRYLEEGSILGNTYSASNGVYYEEIDNIDGIIPYSMMNNRFAEIDERFSDPEINHILHLGGYAPPYSYMIHATELDSQQPHIHFFLRTETRQLNSSLIPLKYDNLPVYDKARVDIMSGVTSRSYNLPPI